MAVVFVGNPESSPASPPVGTLSTITTTSDLSPSSPPSTEPVDQVEAPFVMPEILDGRWQSADRLASVTFVGLELSDLQIDVQLDEPTAIRLTEPASLAAIPSQTQPVEAVLFVTVDRDGVQPGPKPVLARFIVTEAGLELSLRIDGATGVNVLLPLAGE